MSDNEPGKLIHMIEGLSYSHDVAITASTDAAIDSAQAEKACIMMART